MWYRAMKDIVILTLALLTMSGAAGWEYHRAHGSGAGDRWEAPGVAQRGSSRHVACGRPW
jgi:hypothetical protein